MVSKGLKKGTVRFELRTANGAAKVMLAGDFNDWKPRPMQRQKDGTYAAVENLAPGVHEYKFIVNDQWLTDPDNSQYARNCHGTMNSVIRVDA